MSKDSHLRRVLDCGIVAVVRSPDSPQLVEVARCLAAGGGTLPQIRLMPTGGVDLTTAAEFLKAGACCLGVGGQLVEPKAVAERNFERIRELARQYVAIVTSTRAGK